MAAYSQDTVYESGPSGDSPNKMIPKSETSSISAPSRVPYWRFIADQALITKEVGTWPYNGSGTPDDPYQITWIDSDPRNPLLMSHPRKAGITALMAMLTLAASFMSSTYSGCIPQIMEEFKVSEELATLGISLYVLGFGVGPLFWAPLGEMFGCQVIIFLTYGIFTAFNAGAAGSQNIETLLVLRFLAGSFSASAMTNTGAVIADMYEASQRGLATGCFAMAPFMGPVFGPIVGGFLSQSSAGWRWVQGLTAVFSGILWILTAVCVPETYAPVLLRKRASILSLRTGKVYVSAADLKRGQETSTIRTIQKALTLPWKLCTKEPIILLLALYMSVLYGILYMLFGAYPVVYQEGRGWNQGQGGLAFLGVAVGELAGCIFSIPDNIRYTRRWKARGCTIIPEERLSGSMIGGIAAPIGLFWFAWTNGPDIHWMASIAAGAPFGFGMVLLFISIKNYLVDSYTVFAASALAATVVMRSCFGAAFPLFTTYMYHNLGIHWAATLAAFLALACAPIPFVLYRWGSLIRKRCKYAIEAEAIAAIAQGGR